MRSSSGLLRGSHLYFPFTKNTRQNAPGTVRPSEPLRSTFPGSTSGEWQLAVVKVVQLTRCTAHGLAPRFHHISQYARELRDVFSSAIHTLLLCFGRVVGTVGELVALVISTFYLFSREILCLHDVSSRDRVDTCHLVEAGSASARESQRATRRHDVRRWSENPSWTIA
jgi:hypothetical protein